MLLLFLCISSLSFIAADTLSTHNQLSINAIAEATCNCTVTGPFSKEIYYKAFENTCWTIQPKDCSADKACTDVYGNSRNEQIAICPSPSARMEYPFCGDNFCQYTEDCYNCPLDCGFYDPNTACKVIIDCPNYRGSEQRVVTLSFDDGPSENTPYLLDILKEEQVPASFFLLGSNVLSFSDTAKRILREGHVVASHSFSHPDMLSLNNDTVYLEMKNSDEAFQIVFGKDYLPKLMRPPYGNIDDRVMDLMKKMDYTPVMWNMDPQDYLYFGPQLPNAVNFVRNLIRNNTGMTSFIHLGHDLKRESIDVTKAIIKELKAQNVKIVALDDCLGLSGKVYTSSKNYTYSIPNKSIVLSVNDVQGWEDLPNIRSISAAHRLAPSRILTVITMLVMVLGMTIECPALSLPFSELLLQFLANATIYDQVVHFTDMQEGLGMGKRIDGVLKVMHSKSWEERIFQLDGFSTLYEYSSKKEFEKDNPCRTLTIIHAKAVDIPNKKFCLLLHTKEGYEVIVRADSLKSFSDWFSALTFNINLCRVGKNQLKPLCFYSFVWKLKEEAKSIFEPYYVTCSENGIGFLRIESSVTTDGNIPFSQCVLVKFCLVKKVSFYMQNKAVVVLQLPSQNVMLNFGNESISYEFFTQVSERVASYENSIQSSISSKSTAEEADACNENEILEMVKNEGLSEDDFWRGSLRMIESMAILGYKLDQWCIENESKKGPFVVIFLFPGYPEFNLISKKSFKINHIWTVKQVTELVLKKLGIQNSERYLLKTQDDQILRDDLKIGIYGFGLVFAHWCLKIDRKNHTAVGSTEKIEVLIFLPDTLAKKTGVGVKRISTEINITFQQLMESFSSSIGIPLSGYCFQLRNGLTLSSALSISTISKSQSSNMELFLIEGEMRIRGSISSIKRTPKLVNEEKRNKIRRQLIEYAKELKRKQSSAELFVEKQILDPYFDQLWQAMEKTFPDLFIGEILNDAADAAVQKSELLDKCIERLKEMSDEDLKAFSALSIIKEEVVAEKPIKMEQIPIPPPPPRAFDATEAPSCTSDKDAVIQMMKLSESNLKSAINRQKNLLRSNPIGTTRKKDDSLKGELLQLLKQRFKHSGDEESDAEELDGFE